MDAANHEAVAITGGASGIGLERWLEGKLARYKLPKRVVWWEEMPKSAYGKIAKKLIREELERRGDLVAPGQKVSA